MKTVKVEDPKNEKKKDEVTAAGCLAIIGGIVALILIVYAIYAACSL